MRLKLSVGLTLCEVSEWLLNDTGENTLDSEEEQIRQAIELSLQYVILS
jgi:hypothetical protein